MMQNNAAFFLNPSQALLLLGHRVMTEIKQKS
jgi:hypothetical protein